MRWTLAGVWRVPVMEMEMDGEMVVVGTALCLSQRLVRRRMPTLRGRAQPPPHSSIFALKKHSSIRRYDEPITLSLSGTVVQRHGRRKP